MKPVGKLTLLPEDEETPPPSTPTPIGKLTIIPEEEVPEPTHGEPVNSPSPILDGLKNIGSKIGSGAKEAASIVGDTILHPIKTYHDIVDPINKLKDQTTKDLEAEATHNPDMAALLEWSKKTQHADDPFLDSEGPVNRVFGDPKSVLGKVEKGTVSLLAGTGSVLTKPSTLLTLPLAGLEGGGELLSSIFAPSMAAGTAESAAGVPAAIESRDPEKIAKSLEGLVLSGLMTYGLGKGMTEATPEVAAKPTEAPKISEPFRGSVPLEAPPAEAPSTVTPPQVQDILTRFQERNNLEPSSLLDAQGIPLKPAETTNLVDPQGAPLGSLPELGPTPSLTPKPNNVGPLQIPEGFNQPRETTNFNPQSKLDQDLQTFEQMLFPPQPAPLPDLNTPLPPNLQAMKAVYEGQKAQNAPAPLALPPAPEAPVIQLPASLENFKTAKAVEESLANKPTTPLLSGPQLPTTFEAAPKLPPSTMNKSVQTFDATNPEATFGPRYAKQILSRGIDLSKNVGDVGLWELVKRATIDQTGAVGDDLGANHPIIGLAKEAQAEIYRRATVIAKQTGEDVQEVARKLAMASSISQPSSGLVDAQGNPLSSGKTLPTTFEVKAKEPVVTKDDLPLNYDTISPQEKIRYWGRQDIKMKPGQMEGVKALKNMWLANSTVLRRSGEAGKMMADLIDYSTFEHYRQAGEWNKPYVDLVKSLSDAEFKNVVDTLDGRTVKLTPSETNAVAQVRSMLNDAAQKSEGVIPGFNKLENYFPQKATPSFLKMLQGKTGQEWYRNWLEKNNPELSKEEVNAVLSSVRANEDLGQFYSAVQNKAAQSTAKFGNLYKARRGLIPEQYIRRDKAVLSEYFDKAAEQISENKVLGENLSKLDSLLPQIENIADRSYAQSIVENLKKEGKPVQGVDAALRKARSLSSYLISLTSPLQNLTQRGNLFGVKGGNLFDVLKSFTDVYSKEGKDFSRGAGLTGDSIVSALERKAGLEKGDIAAKHHRFTLMQATEQGNRTAAANLGKRIAQKQFETFLKKDDPFAKQTLSELGIDVDAAKRRGALTKDDLASAAFNTVKQTQGLFRKIDLPNVFTKSEGMKMVTQYKAAAHMQAGYVSNVLKEFIRPSNRGKTAINTILLMAWMEGSGQLVDAVKHAIRGKQPEFTPGMGIVKSGLGLGGDVAQATVENGGKYIPDFLLGPTISGGVQMAQGIASGNIPKTLRPILSRIPIVGSTLTPMFLHNTKKEKKSKGGGRSKL